MKRIAMIVTDVAMAGEKGLGRMYYLAELFCKNGFAVDLFTTRYQHWLKRFRTQEEMDAIMKPENFIGRAPEQVDEFIRDCVQPALDRNGVSDDTAEISV